jgi:hypothetical protein
MSYRTDLLDRLVAMEHEALDAYVALQYPGRTGIDAFPYALYEQEATPYIIHRIGRGTLDRSWPEDSSLRSYDVHIRIVVGHVTSNYVGRNEEELNTMIPLLEQYLSEHRDLTTNPSGLYPTPQEELFPEDITIDDTTGLSVFDVGGVKSKHVGEEILIRVPIFWTTLNS